MDTVFTYLYQVGFAVSILVLISLGLALIFGMMKVINLAQGEFLMLGAYFCVLTSSMGAPLWIAIPVAGVLVGLFGVVVERTVIQWLYGRVLDTLLATWGVSLLMIGIVTTVAGPQSHSISSSVGRVVVGGFVVPGWSMVIIAGAVLMLLATYLILRFTNLGLIVRGTMQNPQMARALGTNTSMIYMLTFGFGSALTGLGGGAAGATVRCLADDGWALYRQGVHRGDFGRALAADRHDVGVGSLWQHRRGDVLPVLARAG